MNSEHSRSQFTAEGSNLNAARATGVTVLQEVLQEAVGDKTVTELSFRDTFSQRMTEKGAFYSTGWYEPPPSGISVLFADENNVDRVSFETLRKEKYWPTDGTSAWEQNLFFFYCSTVPKSGLEIGDFALTLYFGMDESILNHFNRCLLATHSVIKECASLSSSKRLFQRSQEVFADLGLENSVVSYTDVTPLDLGHTFPSLAKLGLTGSEDGHLSQEKRDALRTARRFVNGVSDWEFEQGLQFSIEPQLRSRSHPDLPQITFHHLMYCSNTKVEATFDIDELIKRFMKGKANVHGGRG